MSFSFGGPEQMAQLYLDSIRLAGGPACPQEHFEELTEAQLRIQMTYLYTALASAYRNSAEQDVIDLLDGWYTEVVLHLAGASESFREKILKNRIVFPGGVKDYKRFRQLVKE